MGFIVPADKRIMVGCGLQAAKQRQTRSGHLHLHHCDDHLSPHVDGSHYPGNEHDRCSQYGEDPMGVLGHGDSRHGCCDSRLVVRSWDFDMAFGEEGC